MVAGSQTRSMVPSVNEPIFNPGSAYWNQRFAVARTRDRLVALSQAVGRPLDMPLFQYGQLFAAALEFSPDLIIELGRGAGNSTCVFTEAANHLGSRSRVLSLCNSAYWETTTVPKVRLLVPPSWFNPLTAHQADILSFDFAEAISTANRILLFWDAHGFDIAEYVLGVLLPMLAERSHIVLMHDLSDIRYTGQGPEYAGRGLWKGTPGNARLHLGIIDSTVPQAISILDYTSRNQLTLDSAEHSIDCEINQSPKRVGEMRQLLGDEIFSLQGHWFWFSLNEHAGPYTFPKVAL